MQEWKTRLEVHAVKRHYLILDPNHPDMIAVKAFARDRSDARASAASAASDPDDEEYRVWLQREDRRNMT